MKTFFVLATTVSLTSSLLAGDSKDYPNVAEWKLKDTGYHTGDMVKYKSNIFRAAYWAGKEPGELDDKSAKAVTKIVQPVVTNAHKSGTYISVAIGGATDYGFLNLLTAVGSKRLRCPFGQGRSKRGQIRQGRRPGRC
jgi:hypothetical protein